MFWSGCFSLKATGNLFFETGVSIENDTRVTAATRVLRFGMEAKVGTWDWGASCWWLVI